MFYWKCLGVLSGFGGFETVLLKNNLNPFGLTSLTGGERYGIFL